MHYNEHAETKLTQHTIQKVSSLTCKSSRIKILARFKESTSINMTDSVTILLQYKLLNDSNPTDQALIGESPFT